MAAAVARRALGAMVAALTLPALAATAPASAAVGDPLLPDLVTLRPSEVRFQDGIHHDKVRLSNTIANRGAGPFEIFPEPTAGGDCDGDGRRSDDRLAFQRVFEDSADPGSDGYFVRGEDTAFEVNVEPGCMVFHPAHDHFHVEGFSRFELRRESDGTRVARSRKVSFCVVDSFIAFASLPGVPADGYYPFGSGFCDQTSTEGLSVGYADVYGAALPGQSLNVDALRRGRYCLISTADPGDILEETVEDNNAKRRRIRLRPRRHAVRALDGPCRLGA